jgi:carboxypeptidase D
LKLLLHLRETISLVRKRSRVKEAQAQPPATMLWFLTARLVLLATLAQSIRILPTDKRRRLLNATISTDDRFLAVSKDNNRVNVQIPKSPDDHLVTSLPLLKEGTFQTQHWAGHLPSGPNGDKYFFYWLFAPDMNAFNNDISEPDVPLIIWLNGGPACSSMDGLFIENGPFRLTVDGNGNFAVTTDPFSWHKTPAYTLYIDQPVGTGLSFTTSKSYPTNDLQVNIDFYYFLQEFFQLHADKFVTDKVMNRDLFFSGESYAGHYIPSMINYILQQKGAGKSAIQISVRGAAIGNGWTDPYYQYAGADFAYGYGLIGLAEVAAFKTMEKQCQAELNNGNYNVHKCFALIDDIINESHGSTAGTRACSYDIRKSEAKRGDRSFPPGHQVIETYLGGHTLPSSESGKMDTNIWQEVLVAVHATAATDAQQRYQECTDPPYDALAGQDGKGVVDDVVSILKHPDNVELLFFNGLFDMVCNHIGNERFLEELPWDGAESWRNAKRYAWIAPTESSGKVSGYMKEFKNLKFLKVMDAGHMVPMDVPNVAADMMKLLTGGLSFDTSVQDLKTGNGDETCPLCPTCFSREEHDYGSAQSSGKSTTQDDNRMGVFVISYAWLVAGMAVLAFGCGLVLLRSRRNGSAAQRAMVPQYELELPDSSPYYDEPELFDNEENGHAENRIT